MSQNVAAADSSVNQDDVAGEGLIESEVNIVLIRGDRPQSDAHFHETNVDPWTGNYFTYIQHVQYNYNNYYYNNNPVEAKSFYFEGFRSAMLFFKQQDDMKHGLTQLDESKRL